MSTDANNALLRRLIEISPNAHMGKEVLAEVGFRQPPAQRQELDFNNVSTYLDFFKVALAYAVFPHCNKRALAHTQDIATRRNAWLWLFFAN